MGPKNTRSRAGGPKGNELKLINLELVIMGFYTILNTGHCEKGVDQPMKA